jgi:hypothetical protein
VSKKGTQPQASDSNGSVESHEQNRMPAGKRRVDITPKVFAGAPRIFQLGFAKGVNQPKWT